MMNSPQQSIEDFLRGMRDSRDGKPRRKNQDPEYGKGFDSHKELQKIKQSSLSPFIAEYE